MNLLLALASSPLLGAYHSLGDIEDNRLDPGQKPHPSYPTR